MISGNIRQALLITHFHLFHENFTFSSYSLTNSEFNINNQSTYTFICIQWKIDVWYSIKWNTAMLKRTEFSLVRVDIHIYGNTQADGHTVETLHLQYSREIKLTCTPCQFHGKECWSNIFDSHLFLTCIFCVVNWWKKSKVICTIAVYRLWQQLTIQFIINYSAEMLATIPQSSGRCSQIFGISIENWFMNNESIIKIVAD